MTPRLHTTSAFRSMLEKSGSTFDGVSLLLCENPLPPLDEAIEAAAAELPLSNHYTEAYSEPLRTAIADSIAVHPDHVHLNAGSELILRQLFDRFGRRVHLITPTYPLFEQIAVEYTETRLDPQNEFQFDLNELKAPRDTLLVVIVNPNNPNGGIFEMGPLPGLLERHPDARFIVDEAFIGLAGETVVPLVPSFPNLIVTRTFSKAHSLAGFRIGYAVASCDLTAELNVGNDAYPLARPSLAAAMATLRHGDEIARRAADLRRWARTLAADLQQLRKSARSCRRAGRARRGRREGGILSRIHSSRTTDTDQNWSWLRPPVIRGLTTLL